MRPLVLTLELDAAAFAFFDQLRRENFPAERNLVPAHISLFYWLPGGEEAKIDETLREISLRRRPMPIRIAGLRNLGCGVAYATESSDLMQLRNKLANLFSDWLSAQDRQRYRPHITIQNKAAPAEATELCEKLRAEFSPWTVTAVGLALWRYRNGPWEVAGKFRFGAEEKEP